MKISEIQSLLVQLRRRPLRTFAVLFAIVASLTVLAWITTFAQEKAKQWVNPTEPLATADEKTDAQYTLIDLTKNGFIGLRKDISPIEAVQRFGLPKESTPNVVSLEYPSFTMGFDDKGTLMHIRFNWQSETRWKTTSGLAPGSTRGDVLRIFGEPRQALLGASMYYYDRFAVEFDNDEKISSLILYIRETDDLTFADIEREALELLMLRPELARKLGVDKDPQKMIVVAGYLSLLRRPVLSEEWKTALEKIKTEHPDLVRMLEEGDE